MSMAIQKAIIYATLKHEGQKRKGTNIPYIVHPMEVMQILTELRCTENVIIAGILHDTLEDTDATPEEIKQLFGVDVLSIVQGESEDKSKTWKERKAATIERLKGDNPATKLVCFADKLSNIRSMYRDKLAVGAELWKRFNADKDSIEWYYRGVAAALLNPGTDGKMSGATYSKLYKEFKKTIDKVFQ